MTAHRVRIAPAAVCAACGHAYRQHHTDHPRPYCGGIHDTGWTWHGCHCAAFVLGPAARTPGMSAPDDRNDPEA